MDHNVHSTFWKAVEIYISKPHTVNKRVSGVVHLGFAKVPAKLEATVSADLIERLACNSIETLTNLQIKLGIDNELLDLQADNCEHEVGRLSAAADPARADRMVIVNKLLSKNTKIFSNSFEMVLIDFPNRTATFICAATDPSATSQHCSAANPPFSIAHQPTTGDILIRTAAPNSRSDHWLQSNLLPKLRNWSVPVDDAQQDAQRTSIGTHSQLHSQEEYITLYNALKLKYGLDMVQRWPEQTDAAKFVYEDVAIATYLLVLWRQEREASGRTDLQSFVDLGCGNGLLVYILASEGHRGYGIDLRKRGIWDMYPAATTELRVEAIVPSDASLYPDIDWIIGNHSDELSPWIPVIAARSAPQTRYFVLPCCAFEFNGQKFQRRSTGDSQYNGFLAYVERISVECGFETAMDRLKIPSTKRVCLIGRRSAAVAAEFAENCLRIQRFIDGETRTTASDPQRAWSSAFKPRASVEEVRNCSKIERSLQTEIVQKVVEHLLAKRRFVDALPRWNIGGMAPIAELVRLFPGELLKKLKSECGGMQTLLRNHNQIFRVEKGTVQIRAPLTRAERSALVAEKKLKVLVKQRTCWFNENHPDGCPIASEDCNFIHAE